MRGPGGKVKDQKCNHQLVIIRKVTAYTHHAESRRKVLGREALGSWGLLWSHCGASAAGPGPGAGIG